MTRRYVAFTTLAALLFASCTPQAPPVKASRANVVVLAQTESHLSAPVWLPNGRGIAFVAGTRNRPSDLWVVDPDTGDQRLVLTGIRDDQGGASTPVWVPGKERFLIVERVDAHEHLWVTDAQVPAIREVPNGSSDAVDVALRVPQFARGDWISTSADGTTIAWRSWIAGVEQIRAAEPDQLIGTESTSTGSALLQLESRPIAGATAGFSLSPDGGMLVASLRAGRGYDLFVFDVSPIPRSPLGPGDALRRLTISGEATGVWNTSPAFSPDEEWVAYAASGQLSFIRTGGSGPVVLPGGETLSRDQPTWSQDGTSVAFQQSDTEGTGSRSIIATAKVAPILAAVP